MHETCRVHVVNNTEGASSRGQASSSVRVLQAVPISDVAVLVHLEAPAVTPLQVRDGSPGGGGRSVVESAAALRAAQPGA